MVTADTVLASTICYGMVATRFATASSSTAYVTAGRNARQHHGNTKRNDHGSSDLIAATTTGR